MKTSLMILLCLGTALACRADLTLADGGVARCPIVVDPQATPAERNAAGELAAVLGQVTGARFSVQDASASLQGKAIHVGISKASRERFVSVPFDSLGAEELVIVSGEAGLLLAGGRPRGTLYAVSRFLETQCGVRWWTPRLGSHGRSRNHAGRWRTTGWPWPRAGRTSPGPGSPC